MIGKPGLRGLLPFFAATNKIFDGRDMEQKDGVNARFIIDYSHRIRSECNKLRVRHFELTAVRGPDNERLKTAGDPSANT